MNLATALGFGRTKQQPPFPYELPYRADIDGLRAVAVAAVLAYHAFPGSLPGGFIGVDVFFVISGYLISSLIFKAKSDGTFSYAKFYGARIRRILPALLTVLVTTFLVGWVFLLPQEYRSLGRQIIAGSFYVPNLYLLTQTGYFAEQAQYTPLLHLWSLGVEEQFYLIWPFIVLLAWRRNMAIVLGVCAAVSLLLCIAFVHTYQPQVFYLPVTRFWELLGGAALAWRGHAHVNTGLVPERKLPSWLREVFSLTGLGLIALSAVYLTAAMEFPGWLATLPVVGAMMLIAAGPSAFANRFLLASRPFVFVGLISYPLYLWHWPILSCLWIIKEFDPSTKMKWAALLMAFILALGTYWFVEKPIRGLQAPAKRRRAALGLLAGTFATAALGACILLTNGIPERFPRDLRPFAAYDFKPPEALRERTCFLQQQPPGDWKAAACVDPPRDGAPLVVLWGDSTAAHLRPGFLVVQKTHPFRLAQMTAGGCPPFIGPEAPPIPECAEENAFFLRQIQDLKPAIVILSADWYDYGYGRTAPTIAALHKAGVQRIIFVGPVPFWRASLPHILLRTALTTRALPKTLPGVFQRVMTETDLQSFAEANGAVYVSPRSALCKGETCMTRLGDTAASVVAWDNFHFSEAGSQFVVASLAPKIFAPN